MHGYIVRVVLFLEEYLEETGSMTGSGSLCCHNPARAHQTPQCRWFAAPSAGHRAHRAKLCLLPHLSYTVHTCQS